MSIKSINKTQKVILIIITIFIIISIYLFILLLKYNNTQTNNINNNTLNQQNILITEEVTDSEEYEVNSDINKAVLEHVKFKSDYFTIKSLSNNYINLLAEKDIDGLKNVLSPEYISKYKINDENIFNTLTIPKLTNDSQYYKINIKEMLTTQIDELTHLYIVKANCRIVNGDTKFNINLMFKIDTFNKTYYIYPSQYISEKGLDKLKSGDILNNYNEEKVEKNEYNVFNYVTITDKDMANNYFNDLKELLLYYKDEAYSKLDEQYSKKRFGSKENFETYLKENNLTIALMNTDKCKVKSYQNYTDYICSDKYDNIYIFRQQGGIMRYSVFLDNYTIMSEEDKEYYNKLDKFDKAKYNLTKFIRMVNTKDYNAIYNVLDTTFRTNNFSTADKFKSYLKSNMYDCNTTEIKDYDDKTYEYYVFSCKITNMKNTNESKNMTIIINQTEGTEFTMSFSFE